LRRVTGATYQERCVALALRHGISVYSAHTNLDNAGEGVNYRIASVIGLQDLDWLEEKPVTAGCSCGSGVIGSLPAPERAEDFLRRLKDAFGVECLMHTDPAGKTLRRIALCGGAGSFLMDEARARGADAFITGEISYHHFFDAEGMLLVAMGHYQSERFTKDLLRDFLSSRFPELRVEMTSVDTNPIRYTF
jgi:putative NIF3 family GTP cyclohydrolase 1 type 2